MSKKIFEENKKLKLELRDAYREIEESHITIAKLTDELVETEEKRDGSEETKKL